MDLASFLDSFGFEYYLYTINFLELNLFIFHEMKERKLKVYIITVFCDIFVDAIKSPKYAELAFQLAKKWNIQKYVKVSKRC